MTVTLKASRDAGSDTAIVFAADGAYARFAMHAASQLAALHPQRDFDICICGLNPPDPVPQGLRDLNLRMCQVSPGTMFDGLRLDPGRTQIVYLRLALPVAFAGQYRRILYLDSDIFVQGGEFGALLNVDMGAQAIGAVRDNKQWRNPSRQIGQFRSLDLPPAPYFNAGVMLIDVSAWLDQEIGIRACTFGRAHHDKLRRHDQNLLNAVLAGDWAELGPTWNWQYTRASNIWARFAVPNVIHFIGPEKPWTNGGYRHPTAYRRAFRGFLARNMPDAPQVEPDQRATIGRGIEMTKSGIKHAQSAIRFRRLLRRFPHDLTVYSPAQVSL